MMAKEISRKLAQRAEDVARYLLPNGKKQGNEWRVGNIAGDSGKSLGVQLTGSKAGVWCDFATNDSGDLLDLWALKRNLKLSGAITEAAHYLGITIPKFDPVRSSKFVKPSIMNGTKVTSGSQVCNYLITERKLNTKSIEAYGLQENEKEIIFPYFCDGKLKFVKYLNIARVNGKKQIRVEANCEPCLFGWHLIANHARSIILCEGELDALSLYEYGFSALSVPFGGGSGNKQKWIEHEFDRLSIFDEIYLCFDNDSAGELAVTEIIERLGRHRCHIVKLPYKDVNECLQNNVTTDIMQRCFNEAKTLDPQELKSATLFAEEVINEFYPPQGVIVGYNTPWDKGKNKILFRPDELSIWTGINGHGKSQFLGQILLAMMNQGARVCIASLEIKPKRLLMRLTRQAGAIQAPSNEYIKAIHEWYNDKLWIFDLVGTAKSQRLLDVFLYAKQRYGIDVFVIDSFMKLDIAEDDYKSQKSFIEQLCDFKNQHNCQIHLVVHPRKSSDETTPPGKLDNKGTGAISDLADNCFSIWRNKEKELLIQKKENGVVVAEKELKKLDFPDCFWTCDKQRNGDWEGRLSFWFHAPSLQYLPASNHRPVRLVVYSNIERV